MEECEVETDNNRVSLVEGGISRRSIAQQNPFEQRILIESTTNSILLYYSLQYLMIHKTLSEAVLELVVVE